MMREVLEKRQRILGDEHPDTITAIGNLAITLGDQGKLEEAAAMMREVLEKRQRILGNEHPDTITAMNNFAIALRAQENAHGSNHTNPYTTTPKKSKKRSCCSRKALRRSQQI